MKYSHAILAVFALLTTALFQVKAFIPSTCTKNGHFALTFDDGPNKDNTVKVLGMLAAQKVKAAFHISVSPDNVDIDPSVRAIISKIASDGHMAGIKVNAVLAGLSAEQIKSTVQACINKLRDRTGITATYVRVGATDAIDSVHTVLQSMGLTLTAYSIDSGDYAAGVNIVPNFEGKLVAGGYGSFISVQRDATPQAVEQTPAVIAAVKNTGYTIVRLDECITGQANSAGSQTNSGSTLQDISVAAALAAAVAVIF